MYRDLPDPATFQQLSKATPEEGGGNIVPMYRTLFADSLTPVLAYRRLVTPDDRLAPSFLLESVVGGERIGRYSFIGSRPGMQLIARGHEVKIDNQIEPGESRAFHSDNPLSEMRRITADWKLARVPGLPDFTGGWVGYAGYDTVRYLEAEKLASPPPDDRDLPDLQMQLYHDLVAFDHVQKTVLVITHVNLDRHASLEEAYAVGQKQLDALTERIETPRSAHPELGVGEVNLSSPPPTLAPSNMGEGGYQQAVRACKEYIAAGDAFQIVPSQRFTMSTGADPFDIYRALRVVNPSPYMFYMQTEGCILIGSSPEILCRVDRGKVVSRPLAGTRHRGKTPAEDAGLERELLADPKDRAEHIMLVDLHRNDVGRVSQAGSIKLADIMTVERYSHVMHISSEVQGKLRSDMDAWDALRYSLPVGTVSGAPKVRAMQIIDELEPTRRGPYGGAVGYADFNGNMDMAIALRTMVVMPERVDSGASSTDAKAPAPARWQVHIQVGAGIVAESDPEAEHIETVNKAAALAKSVALAEQAFA